LLQRPDRCNASERKESVVRSPSLGGGDGLLQNDETSSTGKVCRKTRLLPVLLEPVITKGSYFLSDRTGHLGYDDIANPLLIQRLDKFVIEKTGIGSYSDPVDARGNLSQTFFEEFRRTRRGINVSRS